MAQDENIIRRAWDKAINWEHLKLAVSLVLIIMTGAFLAWSFMTLSHDEFEEHIIPHVFAVFLELLLAVLLIELMWRNHEKSREKEVRLTQLRLIKSQMFQSDMLELFRVNFEALDKSVMVKNHKLSLDYLCKEATKDDLREIERWLTAPENVETTAEENTKTKDKTKKVNRKRVRYQDGGLAKVFMRYIDGEKNIWGRFLKMAIAMDIEHIVKDMTEIQCYIASVKNQAALRDMPPQTFLDSLINNNTQALVYDVPNAYEETDDTKLARKIHLIAARGILKYVEFMLELRQNGDKEKESIELLSLACGNFCHTKSRPAPTEIHPDTIPTQRQKKLPHQSKLAKTQIMSIIAETIAGRPANEIVERYSYTYYELTAQYGEPEASESTQIKELERENS